MKLIFVLSLLALHVCATPTGTVKKPKGRIFNGDAAKEGQFPYQVYIRDVAPALVLSGAILSQDWIITQGYWLRGSDRAKIQAGSNYRTTSDPNKVAIDGEAMYVSNISDAGGWNDIGLIKLKTPLTFNAHIKPIRIRKEPVEENTVLTVSGWGEIREDKYPNPVNDLRYTNLSVISEEKCKEASGFGFDQCRMCCNSTSSRIRRICRGDDGDPLVIYEGPEPLLVGIAIDYDASHNNYCREQHRVSAFIKVYKFVDWIKKITGLDL